MTGVRQKAEPQTTDADVSHGPLNKVNVHHIRAVECAETRLEHIQCESDKHLPPGVGTAHRARGLILNRNGAAPRAFGRHASSSPIGSVTGSTCGHEISAF